MKLRKKEHLRALIIAILAVISVSLQVQGCEKNCFFVLGIPVGWKETCFHGPEKYTDLPSIAIEYMNQDETLAYQYSYALILKGDIDGKSYITHHLSKDLDTTFTEDLCYYKQEDFHGMPALSYTFAGITHGVGNTGKIYFVKANGFSMLFVNYFIPNKSGRRFEIDVWKSLKWLPQQNWNL